MLHLITLRLWVRSQAGASAVEYGLLISGIAALIALIVYAFGGSIADLFSETCTSVTSRHNGTSC